MGEIAAKEIWRFGLEIWSGDFGLENGLKTIWSGDLIWRFGLEIEFGDLEVKTTSHP